MDIDSRIEKPISGGVQIKVEEDVTMMSGEESKDNQEANDSKDGPSDASINAMSIGKASNDNLLLEKAKSSSTVCNPGAN